MRRFESFSRCVLLGALILSSSAAVQAADGAASAGPAKAVASSPKSAPVNVIFDTDMWADIDDALALAVLHGLQSRHEANIVAMTVSSADRWSVSYVDLVNTFYGHPEIPVGVVHDGIDLRAHPELLAAAGIVDARYDHLYTQVVSEHRAPGGAWLYPRRLADGSKAPEAVALLRKTLAAQPDGSVVMIQVGYSTNFARLIDSAPDQYSALQGRELVKRKVRLLSVMAGAFGGSPSGQGGFAEFNVAMDVPAAAKVFRDWPTPVVASGAEIGAAIVFPAARIESDFSYVEHHPIVEGVKEYRSAGTFIRNGKRTSFSLQWPYDRATFDLTTVLYAIRPEYGYFSVSKPGRISVRPNGATHFDEAPDGLHRYLILTDEQKVRTQEAMMMLASQPPVH